MQQLELDFDSAIALARLDPFQMELKDLLGQFEPSLEGLAKEEKLRLAGDRLVAMAEVLQQKAEAIFDDWCDRHNDEGPIPDEDFLAGLVQETMFLDVSGVVRSPKGRRKVEPDELDIDSAVTEMDKEELLKRQMWRLAQLRLCLLSSLSTMNRWAIGFNWSVSFWFSVAMMMSYSRS